MENKLYVGSIVKIKKMGTSGVKDFQTMKTSVLYKDSDSYYTDLDYNITYPTLNNNDLSVNDLAVSNSSLIETSFDEYKKDYYYLMIRHLENPGKIYKKKRHINIS